MPNFTHLHVHSHYSLLDGLPKIPQLIANAKTKNFDAIALTDHGAMHGIIEFYKEATSQNIKPILGIEMYVAPRRLTDKQARLDDANYHLVLLAENIQGYQNLLKLNTIAHLQGFYYKPRIDHDTLKQYSQGIVALSACFKGEIPQALRRQDPKQAVELIKKYQSIFGEENFYLEIQAHPELPDQVKLNDQLAELAKTTSVPLVATNDAHYLESADGEAQDILVCIQTGKTVNDEKRLNMTGLDCSLKTEEQMRQDLPDYNFAIDNSYRLGQKLNVAIPLGKRFFPSYPTPGGETPEAYLRLLTEQGLVKHYPNGVEDEVRDRLEYELGIIMKKGYASYFLVVADFVNWSRSKGIIATTRGSAAGSLASFLIGITTVNPLTYQLPFERFLNPERPSPPDIDMDFADNKRDEVISYVTAKYGLDHVAQIVTFGTMAARGSVRDVGRALGYPYGLCDKLAKLIPMGSQGFHMTIERALKESKELSDLYEQDPQIKKLIDLAQKVEGCARHASVHAAGVVISPTPLTDYTPLQYDVEGQHVITQYDMWSCEDSGLVKMDFLGIRNLSIMGSAVTIIEKTKGLHIDISSIPLNDKKTFALMAKGETMGMFQLGGSGMTRYLKELKPSTITDIMAMVALFRPGPMNSIPEFIKRKHHPKTITYLDPRLATILESSYGIITYQDDVLLIAINLAGYSWEEADKLRKAMGKKIVKEMARQKEKFIGGCIEGGLNEAKARQLWELIEPFAAYGFNKSHAASYGIVAYQTAYLKANYPTEFMAALMTAESGNMDTVAEAVSECKKMGIDVLPPDVNESLSTFTMVGESKIRFGLAAIKNLGEHIIASLIQERKQNGPFTSLENFVSRTAGKDINKRALESLIKSGALDSLHPERHQLLESMEAILAYVKKTKDAADTKQTSLFGAGLLPKAEIPLKLLKTDPTNQQQKLAWEKELLGLYVTEHPLTQYQASLQGQTIPLNKIAETKGQPQVTVAGLIISLKQITTKKGDAMAFCTLEDMSGTLEIIVFPETYRRYKNDLSTDKVVKMRGKISNKNGDKQIILEQLDILEDPNLTTTSDSKQFEIDKPTELNESTPVATACQIKLSGNLQADIMNQLKFQLLKSTGPTKVYFEIEHNGKLNKVATPFSISLNPELISACEQLLGKNCLTIID